MLTRRKLLGAAAAALAGPALAGSSAEETPRLGSLSGKKPLIQRAFRPPNFETPLEGLRPDFTPNDLFFVRYHLDVIPRVDRETWRFTVGDQVKIRLVNEMDSDHPMHHPFHLHGAGRFLVLARDGLPEPNLVWKDTVLVRTGQTVDILFDVSNPGLWMAHCHIAEHMQSGMMFSFTVARHPAAE